MIAANTVASKVTRVCRCRRERVFTPGLTDLFEPLSVVSAATHSVKILRNKGMVVARQGNPSHILSAFVTGIGPQSNADAAIDSAIILLIQPDQVAYNDICTSASPNTRL